MAGSAWGTAGRWVGGTLLLALGMDGAVALVGLVSGWRSTQPFGLALVLVGAAVMGAAGLVGRLSGIADGHLGSATTYRQIAPVIPAEQHEQIALHRGDTLAGYGPLGTLFVAGSMSVALGLLLMAVWH